MNRKTVSRFDSALIIAATAVLVVIGIAATKPGRPMLTVWSCGSNYESLSDFSRHFEQKYNCRVRYSAAPVAYLLELAMEVETPPDVMVGRGGPGWEALRQAGELAKGPIFFALDPYVIITPLDNPANIQGIEDLGRDGVRVAASPWAMRPRGMCPAHLVLCVSDKFFPGLVERWENNITVPMKCGRELAGPVVAGKVDAAIVPRCMTSFPSIKGKVSVIPIKPKYLLALKKCRATIPQCCGILEGARNPELADRFVREMAEGIGPEVLSRHGYLPMNSPEARALKPLAEIFKPKNMSAWQCHMARGLYEDGAYRCALRRNLVVISMFGPSHYDARSRYLAGLRLKALGQQEAARIQWQRVIAEFPRRGRMEWESKVFRVGKPVPGIENLPEEHWVARASQELAARQAGGGFAPEHKRWLTAFRPEHISVKAGDPGKNGTRMLALGKDLLEAGHYVGATRDLLKVLSLNYPSKHIPEARFWLGVVTYLRGLPVVAGGDWKALAAGGDDEWREQAARAQRLATAAGSPGRDRDQTVIPMPPWKSAYETNVERGMTYGMMLWEHHLPLYCFKEMMKVCHGIYGKAGPLVPMARYRAGVCCRALGKPEAAYRQLAICELGWPESKWAELAAWAKTKLPTERRGDRLFAASQPSPKELAELKKPPKTGWGKRFIVGEELLNAGIFEDDQALLEYWKAMTVTDPSQEKNVKLRPIAEYKAGVCCRKVGREGPARGHFERVLELYPKSPAAKLARTALEKGGRVNCSQSRSGGASRKSASSS